MGRMVLRICESFHPNWHVLVVHECHSCCLMLLPTCGSSVAVLHAARWCI
jgi:hypothetical protein